MPADASSPIPLAFDRLREHPGAVPGEIPGLLERLTEVPGPRDPRGVRNALVVMLALTACAVLAGATSLPAVGEWITDAPPSVLERLGVRPDPLSPKRCLRRRRRCVGCWAASTAPRWTGRWPPAGRPARWSRRPAARSGGRRQDPAPSSQGHGPHDSSTRRLRPPLRPGPGPTRRW
ncbi:transposase family protein [Streptomyces mirabilis]|uniref:transposase family protein n=1 Tax=Streptomyces mirabilis TaxID=68239 RepID=UPI003648E980